MESYNNIFMCRTFTSYILSIHLAVFVLLLMGEMVVVRVPLIPHYNTAIDMENYVRILKEMAVRHFDSLTNQVQANAGRRFLRRLTGKLPSYGSRKNG